MHSIGFIACNIGKKPTFQRSASESIIDITFASHKLMAQIKIWEVLEDGTESDHNYIYFVIDEPRQNTQQKPQGWVVRKLEANELEAAIDLITTTSAPGTDADTYAHRISENLRDMCNKVMPKKTTSSKRKSVHWWNPEIGALRKTINHLRRVYQRKVRRTGPDDCQTEKEEAKTTKRNLYKAIKYAKEQSWKKLCEEVEIDPWGLSYRLVMGKLVKNSPITDINKTGRIEDIIKTLFLTHPPRPSVRWESEGVVPQITNEELQNAAMQIKNKKAPRLYTSRDP